MITPEQMLQEAIERINSLSVDELEAMFREAGFNPVRRVFEDYSSLSTEMTKTQQIEVVALSQVAPLDRNFTTNDSFVDMAA
jgi:hypothetical protein